jgi:DNA helicase HerA-like ATPase
VSRPLRLGAGLELPQEAVTQTFAILAKRGAGKTYAALVLAEELLKLEAQVVIADPVGVCWGPRAWSTA